MLISSGNYVVIEGWTDNKEQRSGLCSGGGEQEQPHPTDSTNLVWAGRRQAAAQNGFSSFGHNCRCLSSTLFTVH